MNVDRVSRDKLVVAIDSYLHEEATAFQFDDAVFDIRDKTDDDTVKRVADFLWCFYDDLDDHQVILDRVGWNCFQRLRLLLKSDAHMDVSKVRIWSVAQLVAAVALLIFLWLAHATGFGAHLAIVAMPFGLISICLSNWRTRLYRSAGNWDITLYPFTSVAQLLWVGHGVTGFRKERFPSHLASRRIRRTVGLPAWTQYVFWLLYSPAVLLAQLLPVTVLVRRVVP